jgi:hypothetical protein
MRSAELRSCAPVEAMCLCTVRCRCRPAGQAQEAQPSLCLPCARSRDQLPAVGRLVGAGDRGGRKRDETNAHREQKYLGIRLTPYRPETMVEAAGE